MQIVPAPTAPRASVTRSLHRAAGLLRLLSTHTQIGWRLSDLAKHSDLDPATVHRLLAGLGDERLVTRVPGTRHYTLGPLAYELGIAAQPYFDLDRHVRRTLAAMAQELRGTLFLKIRSGVDSVCVARHDGSGPFSALMLDVGGRRSLCLTAGGVAMLMGLPRAEQKEIELHNLRTIARQDEARCNGVRQMLRRSRQLGFGVNLGYIVPGISAISVPILSKEQTPVASLSLALAAVTLSPARARALALRLRGEAAGMEPLLARLRF